MQLKYHMATIEDLVPEEASKANQKGQAQDTQTGKPHRPGGRPHEALR